MKKEMIHIVVVGDDGVGKTSLVSTYISRMFSEEVSKVAQDVELESEINPSKVQVKIMDTSNDPGDQKVRDKKICLADCVVVLYDSSRLNNTLTNVANTWLPLLQQIYQEKLEKSNNEEKLRVILCGTKSDLLSPSSSSVEHNNNNNNNNKILEEERNQLQELLASFPIIVSSFKCCAKALDGSIESVFHHAELAVSHPIGPIYDINQSTFTGHALLCFLRVFRIFDRDTDGLLNDGEFRSMHGKCFYDTDDDIDELSDEELQALKKEVISFNHDRCYDNNTKRNSNIVSIRNNSFTFDGFLAMMALYLDKSKPQVPWMILKSCGYTDNISLVLPVGRVLSFTYLSFSS